MLNIKSSPLKVLWFLVFCFKRNSSHASSKISSSFSNHLATPFSMLQPLPPIMTTKCKAVCHKLDAKVENHPHQSSSHKNQKKTWEKNFIKSFPWPWAMILRISPMFSSTIQAPQPCHPHILQCELLRGNLEVEPTSPPSGSSISFIGKVSTFFKSRKSGTYICTYHVHVYIYT